MDSRPSQTSTSDRPAQLYTFQSADGIASLRTCLCISACRCFPRGSVVKNPPGNVKHAGLIPGWEDAPGKGDSNLLQYSCLGNPMDRGAPVHGVAKSQTQLSDLRSTTGPS